MNLEIDSSWKEQLAYEFEEAYFKQLCDNVDRAYKGNQCFPPIDLVFNAFNLCPFDKVKVVIIGQDPYPREGQAHGLSFSFDGGKPFPRSLNTIFKVFPHRREPNAMGQTGRAFAQHNTYCSRTKTC